MRLRSGSPGPDPDAVEQAIGNERDRRILAVVQAEQLSPQAIVDETDIPQSTVYRRLEALSDEGLVEVTGGRMRGGHPVDLYSATVEMAGLKVEEGAIEAEWRLVESPDERLHRLWTQLRDPRDG